jgi:hypothetical protein
MQFNDHENAEYRQYGMPPACAARDLSGSPSKAPLQSTVSAWNIKAAWMEGLVSRRSLTNHAWCLALPPTYTPLAGIRDLAALRRNAQCQSWK